MVLILDEYIQNEGVILHAGDSRAYRFRKKSLLPLTRDHSLSEAIHANKKDYLPPEFRGVITNAVGLKDYIKMEKTPVDVHENDIFLLCSDGLSDMIDDATIARILTQHPQIDAACDALIEAANANGGRDNVTALLVHAA